MSEIDNLEDIEVTKSCYKYKERLYGQLNITYNEENSIVIFWNKYQIFLHEDLNFEDVARNFVPEFQIRQLIVSNNYLVCIDFTGTVHVTSLKFKHTGQKKFKSSFQQREQGILHAIKYTIDTSLSLKFESDTLFLCMHKINSEFQLEKKVVLKMENEEWPVKINQGQIIINCHRIKKEDFGIVSDFFHVEDVWKDHNIILISFDKITVYTCLFSHKSSDNIVQLVKLYVSPTEICDLLFNEENGLNALVALTTGTLVQLALRNIKSSTVAQPLHLNTALAKITGIKTEDTFIYTDGKTMWIAENTHSEENIKFKQFFIKDVKDFLKFGDQLICTTYTNLIYKFCFENEDSFLKFDENEYCAAEKLLNHAELVYRITHEIEKCHDIVRRTNDEGNFISALSLTKRQDVMDNITDQNITVFESYEEVMKENIKITLAEKLHKYFEPESLLFLLKITTTDHQTEVNNTVLNLLQDLTIHITFLSEEKVLNTNSIKVKDHLRKINILVPLRTKGISQVIAEVKFVREIPGSLDKNKKMWPTLSRKQFVFNSEHFIQAATSSNKLCILKEVNETVDDLILKTANKLHGNLFHIKEPTHVKETNNLSFYIKLPENYTEVFRTEKLFEQHLNCAISVSLHKQFTNKEFLRSKSSVNLEIGTKKVKIEILNDHFCALLLKVSGDDLKVAFSIRNFLANILYGDFKNYVPEKEFVSNALYTTTENLQKALKSSSMANAEEVLKLAEQFHQHVIGSLPL